MQITAENLAAIVSLAIEGRADKKLEAIKLVRACAGVGLKDAKDLVEVATNPNHVDPVVAGAAALLQVKV